MTTDHVHIRELSGAKQINRWSEYTVFYQAISKIRKIRKCFRIYKVYK